MSHSPLQPTDSRDREAQEYVEAHRTLVKLLREGMSWSGLERDCLFLNTGGPRFATASAISGLDLPDDGRGLAAVDWDRDGDLDLISSQRTGPQVHVMRNDSPGAGRALAVRLEGKRGNRDGIGARLELRIRTAAGTQRIVRGLRAGEGYLSQGSRWVHFGIGDALEVLGLDIRWRGGAVEAIGGLAAGGRYLIVEGSGLAQPVSTPGKVALEAAPLPPRPPDPTLVLLRGDAPAPKIEAEGFDGKPLPIPEGRPLLLNLWASWCKPCRAELTELARRAGDLRRAGIEVAALSVDGLGDPRGLDADAPRRLAAELSLPFPTGRAPSATVDRLEVLQNLLLGRDRGLPVPASFLVDADGSLVAIARGVVGVDEIIAALGRGRGRADRRAAAPPFPGRWHAEPPGTRLGLVAQAMIDAGHLDEAERCLGRAAAPASDARGPRGARIAPDPTLSAAELNLGSAFLAQEQLAEARRHLQAALRLDPALVEAHVNLATVMAREGDGPGARSHLEKALALRPDDPTARHNLDALSVPATASLAEASYLRGLELARHGNAEGAVRALQDAVAKEPAHVGSLLALGTALSDLGRTEAAIPHLLEALRHAPDDAMVHRKLALILVRLGRFEASEPHFRAALRAEPDDATAHLNLGLALLALGRPKEAADAFRDALARDGSLVAARGNLGLALHEQGQAPEAAAAYRRALDLDPGYARARLHLAWLLATTPEERLRSGREAVNLAEGACPPSTCADGRSLHILGAAYAEAGRWSDALAALTHAIDLAATAADRDRYREHREACKRKLPIRADRPPDASP